MKTLIGIVSYGNLEFLELALRGIQETLTKQADILVVIARPDDTQMQAFLNERGIRYIQNHANIGFAGSINDIFEAAWVNGDYDNVIIMGNDVIPYPRALDSMIECAETTEWEWICASQFDSKALVERYPEVRQYFQGDGLVFTDFSARPWELHKDFHADNIEPDSLKDVRNLALFKRSVFEKIGYADVNFWPNGYFEDNDAARRANIAGVKSCGLSHAAYFHFWSRTIHQGEDRGHAKYFIRNMDYYKLKWGGAVGSESASPVTSLKIPSREGEEQTINYWRQK